MTSEEIRQRADDLDRRLLVLGEAKAEVFAAIQELQRACPHPNAEIEEGGSYEGLWQIFRCPDCQLYRQSG